MDWEWSMRPRSRTVKRRQRTTSSSQQRSLPAASAAEPSRRQWPRSSTASAVAELRQAGVQCESSEESDDAACAAAADVVTDRATPSHSPKGYVRDFSSVHRQDAQNPKGSRDRAAAGERQKPQPRISIVGSNWGSARKMSGKNRVAKATQKLLAIPAHVQCALEIVTAQIAQDLREAGYEVAQTEAGGPAVLYLPDNFTLEHLAAKTLMTSTDKYGGTGLFTRQT